MYIQGYLHYTYSIYNQMDRILTTPSTLKCWKVYSKGHFAEKMHEKNNSQISSIYLAYPIISWSYGRSIRNIHFQLMIIPIHCHIDSQCQINAKTMSPFPAKKMFNSPCQREVKLNKVTETENDRVYPHSFGVSLKFSQHDMGIWRPQNQVGFRPFILT